MKKNTARQQGTQKIELKKPHVRRLNPQEFLEVMGRIELINKEMEKETELYEIKIKSLELEKEYLLKRVDPLGKSEK